ncbi:MAG: trehalase family glycosidase [Treponemataceae bacterium]|nr:trehalase family glycosidase [Treponemataceae bacterium]
MNKHDFPKIHFYDQDFVDIYDKSWNLLQNSCVSLQKNGSDSEESYFVDRQNGKLVMDQFESIMSSFFLVYSNRNYNADANIDYFYSRQEDSGAIYWKYDIETDSPIFTEDNPQGIGLPLFAWAEYNLYHKSANKKRIKEIMPVLQKYTTWLEDNFKMENGLYKVPFQSSTMFNSPREGTTYPIDFNSCLAIHALYMSALGDILNDKDLSFQYKRMYFSLKTRINSKMWDSDTGFYYDLDENENQLSHKTIVGFLPLLAEIPNEDKADALISHLNNPETFGTDHPFPSLSADHPLFSENGEGFRGSVFPSFNFMVIKGLERYQRFDMARECTIRHLYYILDGIFPGGSRSKGDLKEAYLPTKEGFATLSGNENFPRGNYVLGAGLSTIALMIENVIGLEISLPRKTVDWVIPNLEIMGIEKLSLKRNLITILSNKSTRGWEIQMESEKLYYFTINILGEKKKALPIPSGKCSMLIDKL